jgi:hypothetical protein
MHVCPVGQHVLPHTWLAGHVQVPLWQVSPDGQTLSQAPQLLGSVWVSTQTCWPCVLVQQVFGGPQEVPPQPQSPPLQVSPDGQTLPQLPQLLASVWVSTHLLSQQLFGGPQEAEPQPHAPALQASPGGQALPQAPQLFTSVWVFTHVLLQQTLGEVHDVLPQ